MASSSWTSIPWTDLGSAYHKQGVPYVPNETYLHTIDVWIPKGSSTSAPSPEYTPSSSAPWIIYIHGGAWRDPLVDASSFSRTALNLLKSEAASSIAGIASINYPLSSHPNHPTHPAPPKDPSQPVDQARTAKHPDHIIAVLNAIAYLQNELGVAKKYILGGHSCGATLTFQVIMSSGRWAKAASAGVTLPTIKKPEVIVPLNGLYDLKYFIDNPPKSHASLGSVYVDFTRGAFGDDEKVWEEICPTNVSDFSAEWPEGKTVVIVQSKEDGLVPYSQTELMKAHLAKHSTLKVVEMDAGGDHNDMWKSRDELTQILAEVVQKYT